MTANGPQVRPLLKTASRRVYSRALGAASLVSPRLRYDPDVRWFIVLTMPNSGSTAVANVLATAPAAIGLTHKCEGEWLVPELSDRAHAWDPGHGVWGPMVRARWLRAVHRRTPPGVPTVVVEKSPPNMVRRGWLEELLAPMPVRFLALVRDPYAVCASWRENYGAGNRSLPRRPRDDTDLCEMLGELYVQRLGHIDQAVDVGVPILRYEDWTRDPGSLVDVVTPLEPLLADFDPHAEVAVKGRPPRPPVDLNATHLASLDDAAIDAISEGLRAGASTVERYGYRLLA